MENARFQTLLSEAVEKMREDVSLLEVRQITCSSHGADVTKEVLGRVEGRLRNLEEILAAYGDRNG